MKILLTAFEPYDHWSSNSSWEALTELLRSRGVPSGVVTRRYPVNLDKLSERMDKDLEMGFDAILHMGQAPGSCAIRLETIAINVAGLTHRPGGMFGPIIDGAPIGYRSECPYEKMSSELNAGGIPASISYHAGTYLCNAILYLSHHWHAMRGKSCPIGFAHFPLTLDQIVEAGRDMPGLPKSELARSIDLMLHVLRESTAEQPRTVLA